MPKIKEKIQEQQPKEEGEIHEEEIKDIKGRWKKRHGRAYGERKRFEKEEKEWIAKTKLGKTVKEGKIKDIDEIFNKGIRIMEAGMVDKLLPDLKSDMIAIGQAKGKFGGGKRRVWRQTQKKTAEENVPSFSCMVVIGDCKGHVGIGMGKAKETLPAREKAMRNAKLSIIKIQRGCGSFNCGCKEPHSIPFAVKGKCGSSEIKLMPASKGTGLVIEDECKKLLSLAGIKDIYSRTSGQTKTKFNLITACFKALEKTSGIIK